MGKIKGSVFAPLFFVGLEIANLLFSTILLWLIL